MLDIKICSTWGNCTCAGLVLEHWKFEKYYDQGYLKTFLLFDTSNNDSNVWKKCSLDSKKLVISKKYKQGTFKAFFSQILILVKQTK